MALNNPYTSTVNVLPESDLNNGQVKQFIADVFARSYDASITEFMPTLLALRNEDEQIHAALGIRLGRDEPLFLECYLDTGIEALLARRLEKPVTRDSIVEVGNLAAKSSGGARLLITALTSYLKTNQYKWAVFTATPLLQRSFERLGIELIAIADADPSRLGEGRAAWGRYYDQPPTVMVANVDQSATALRRLLTLESCIHSMQSIWREAGAISSVAA